MFAAQNVHLCGFRCIDVWCDFRTSVDISTLWLSTRVSRMAAIAWATISVHCQEIKPLQLIWRSGTRRFNLWVPDLQISRDLTHTSIIIIIIYHLSYNSNATETIKLLCWLPHERWQCLISDNHQRIQWLLSRQHGGFGASVGSVQHAAWNGHIETVKLLMKHQAGLNW